MAEFFPVPVTCLDPRRALGYIFSRMQDSRDIYSKQDVPYLARRRRRPPRSKRGSRVVDTPDTQYFRQAESSSGSSSQTQQLSGSVKAGMYDHDHIHHRRHHHHRPRDITSIANRLIWIALADRKSVV